jgi:hypothetical protein
MMGALSERKEKCGEEVKWLLVIENHDKQAS